MELDVSMGKKKKRKGKKMLGGKISLREPQGGSMKKKKGKKAKKSKRVYRLDSLVEGYPRCDFLFVKVVGM